MECGILNLQSGRFGAIKSDSTHHFLEMPVPSQGHYGFHAKVPVVNLTVFITILEQNR
jgi:hypothetical protein